MIGQINEEISEQKCETQENKKEITKNSLNEMNNSSSKLVNSNNHPTLQTYSKLNKSTSSLSKNLKNCRICYEKETETEILISPCLCQGSMKFIHDSCLKTWITNNHKNSAESCSCEICKFEFKMTYKIIKTFSKVKYKTFCHRTLYLLISLLACIILIDFFVYIIIIK